MRKMIRLLLTVAIVTLGTVFAIAQEDDAVFRVAHLSPDAGAVDVYANGDVLLENVAFGMISNWITVPAGTYSVDVTPTGTSAEEAVLSAELLLEAGTTFYTVAAIGFAENPDVRPLTLQVIEEDYSDINLAEARVTIFHAIPNAEPVSVLVNGTSLVDGLGYPTGTEEENDGVYTADVVAGTYDVVVRFTEDAETEIFNLPDTTFTGNRNYFIAAGGLATAPQLVLTSTNPETLEEDVTTESEAITDGTANIRVGHFAEDAPAVDIYVDGSVVLEGITYPALSDFLEVEAGTYTVDVVPAGAEVEEAVLSSEITVNSSEYYTAAAIGLITRPDIAPLTLNIIEEDYSDLNAGTTRFTVFHASPGGQPVDVIVNGDVFVASLAYPGFYGDNDGTVNFDVVSGTYDIQITEAGNSDNVLIDLANTRLTAGNQYFIAAINTPDNLNYYLTSDIR